MTYCGLLRTLCNAIFDVEIAEHHGLLFVFASLLLTYQTCLLKRCTNLGASEFFSGLWKPCPFKTGSHHSEWGLGIARADCGTLASLAGRTNASFPTRSFSKRRVRLSFSAEGRLWYRDADCAIPLMGL